MFAGRGVRVFGLAAALVMLPAAGGAARMVESAAPAVPAPQAAPAAAAAEVKIDNFSFSPATLTVAPGTTVTWTNRDDIPHTVVNTDDPRAFKSKVLDTDEKFSYTFTKAGTFAYFCSVHPKMTGTVVVTAGGK
ncbi:MAG TPA: cupredoxin family copper-binding protein [Candidatus Acidoferrales bacterium]